jgi:GTP diphosphokinase / guanosine-3',5'-bis(diphosphate) 3'-diphosphatase
MTQAKALASILKEVKKYKPNADVDRVKKAYSFAEKFHKGDVRHSGDPYIDYLVDIVETLLALRPDEDTLAATFLQGILKNKDISLEDISKEFGDNVASLLEGINKLKSIKFKMNESEAGTLRKMFLAIAQDLRVVLIKIAGRLVNMQTLEVLSPEKRKKLARETMEIYVPVASRLGIYTLKSDLEDLAFKYLYFDHYENISEQLLEFGTSKNNVIDGIKKGLDDFLKGNGIEAVVEGRIKSVSSIYRKLKKKNKTSVDEVFDVFAMRIILPTKFHGSMESSEHLYSLLGLIHSEWVPLANRFKDYVAVPKSNGYQSLHTTVLGLAPEGHDQPVEIQIRSERMHKEAEFGIASHWLYETTAGKSVKFDRDEILGHLSDGDDTVMDEEANKKYSRHVAWLRGLEKLQQDLQFEQGSDSLEELKMDIFSDRIFVLTPQGEVKDLPQGSTPIDFAYIVHTDIGHRCAMAKANGSIVSLDYELKNGEVIEIVLKPKPNPKPHWLSIVKTSNAKTKIKAWFRGLDRERNVKEGRDLLNKHLKRYGKATLDDSYSILKDYEGKRKSLRDREGVLEEIGIGSQLANIVVKKIFTADQLLELIPEAKTPKRKIKKKTDKEKELVLIGGEANLPYRIAACCKPSKGNDIIAYITKGHSITVHKASCPYVANLDEKRLLDASFGAQSDKGKVAQYRVKFFIEAVTRIGLLRDITEVIASFSARIVDYGMKSDSGNVIVRAVTLDVADFDQFDKILDRIEGVKNVLRVEKDI